MATRLTADDSAFRLSAHPFGARSQPNPAELISDLERALRAIITLPHLAAFSRHALAEFERLNAEDRLGSISAYVAYHLGVTHEELLSKKRTQHIAFCRQVTMYVCRSVSGASFPTLGTHFHRNHASVHYAVKLIARRVRTDGAFRRAIAKIERDLSHITATTAGAA
jgi:chromosomal replication initiator protein